MCDTCGIGPELTGSGISIFSKNSDREADETQLVLSVPSKNYPSKEDLQCTYIAIPQAGSTFAMILSKPFWMWGAEMGVNEKGVVIGNEALFTKVKPEKTPGLIGMDLFASGSGEKRRRRGSGTDDHRASEEVWTGRPVRIPRQEVQLHELVYHHGQARHH